MSNIHLGNGITCFKAMPYRHVRGHKLDAVLARCHVTKIMILCKMTQINVRQKTPKKKNIKKIKSKQNEEVLAKRPVSKEGIQNTVLFPKASPRCLGSGLVDRRVAERVFDGFTRMLVQRNDFGDGK